MPQVSQLPPPYSRDWVSFPPPLQGDVDHCAWAFQLAFENARELVRWTILKTFKEWRGDWALRGKDVMRADVQRSYSLAPEDLKLAVDWQVKWDIPMIMQNDNARRWHEHVRRKEAGTYEEVLAPKKFEQEFEAASPEVQRAVLHTFSTWKWFHEHVVIDSPQRRELIPAYMSAPRPLQAVLCFVVEMALDTPLQRPQDVDSFVADVQEVVDEQRIEAKRWNIRATFHSSNQITRHAIYRKQYR
ncbi:unnamed protein product [Peniophora sp. CBMAI 1063]|nr:unnamed protein product [Peniophora sp. CBMAI 1063]